MYMIGIRDGAFLKNVLTFDIILSVVLNYYQHIFGSPMETSRSACHVNYFHV